MNFTIQKKKCMHEVSISSSLAVSLHGLLPVRAKMLPGVRLKTHNEQIWQPFSPVSSSTVTKHCPATSTWQLDLHKQHFALKASNLKPLYVHNKIKTLLSQ